MGGEAPAEGFRQHCCFGAKLPRPRAAKRSGSVSPAAKARSMARPDTPRMSLTTLRQLDIGALQELMNPIRRRHAIAKQALAVPCQIAQCANPGRRNETRANQAMRQEIGQPLAVAHIGLPPRHGLDVMRVGEHDGQIAFEQIEDRLPVHAGRLHRDVRTRRARSATSCKRRISAVVVLKVWTCF